MADFGQIRIIPGRIITSANNTIAFDEGGSILSATVTPGTYWAGGNTTLVGLGYDDLYTAIKNAMAAAGSQLYDTRAATPTLSTGQTGKGLLIRGLSGTAWSLRPDHASWTFPLELMACLDNDVVSASAIASTTVDGDEVVTCPATRGGEWFAWTMFSDNGLDDPTSFQEFRQVSSDTDATLAYSYDWTEAEGTADFRTIVIPQVLGAHVKGPRALIASFASSAGMGHGDTTNGFNETVWQYARTLRGRGVNASDIIVAYDDDWPEADVAITISDGYDIARLSNASQRANWKNLAQRIGERPERYRMSIDLALKTKGYLQ